MKSFRTLILSVCVLALGACTEFDSFSEVNALNEAQAVGSPFTQSLTDEYKAFSNYELKEMFDYPDALHFARKGLAAAAGDVALPEPISDWNLSPEHIQELSAARGRLIVAFDLGAREVAPALSARAQAKFDCWIEQQEENWQADHILGCKQDFLDAMSELEGMIQAAPPAAEPMFPEPVGPLTADNAPPMAAADAMYLVFFDWDQSSLDTGALNVLDAVVDELNRRPGPTVLNVVAHADTSGPADYNQRLALRRANAVKDALMTSGIDAMNIKIEARGESDLMVETADNVREPANRRASITFE